MFFTAFFVALNTVGFFGGVAWDPIEAPKIECLVKGVGFGPILCIFHRHNAKQ